MKVNQPLLKLIIRLLVLLILFVGLFMISAFLYSARYWKDVYIYLTPNLTISEIPKLSETNIDEYDFESTTENPTSTTDFVDYDFSTIEDLLLLSDGHLDPLDKKEKREIGFIRIGDFDEVPKKYVLVDYFFDYGSVNFEDREKQMVTRDSSEIEIFSEMSDGTHLTEDTPSEHGSCHKKVSVRDLSEVIFPWVITIFVKDGMSNQFQYQCDGALLTNRTVLTAARCVKQFSTEGTENVLLFPGQKSLVNLNGNAVLRAQKIKLNDNYTNVSGNVFNDLAVIVLDKDIETNSDVQTACILDASEEKFDVTDSVTTGWHTSGDLKTIRFNKEDNSKCKKDYHDDNVFCATFGFDTQTCPSYGGLHMVKLSNNQWYLKGILAEDPNKRGFCISKSLKYTDLTKYRDWIKNA